MTLNNSGTLPALDVTGSGFFRLDGGGLASTVGAGIRVFLDSGSGIGQVFSYDYDAYAQLARVAEWAASDGEEDAA